jgi:transcriptional regulator with XRE-family HTH domain
MLPDVHIRVHYTWSGHVVTACIWVVFGVNWIYMKDSSNKGAKPPYAVLGTHLRFVREQRSETLAEVSGAVEIDADTLERIEDGHERPSEDILMLLINHFNMQDQEAVQLWESAGYEGDDAPGKLKSEVLEKAAVVVLAMDVRTMYSDGVIVDANKSGVVLSFMQAGQNAGQQVPVSKVGMSYEQAEMVIASLQQAVLYGRHASASRQLPPGDHES